MKRAKSLEGTCKTVPPSAGHRDRVAWEAVEWNDKVHANLSKLQKVSVQMYTYHFSKCFVPFYAAGQCTAARRFVPVLTSL